MKKSILLFWVGVLLFLLGSCQSHEPKRHYDDLSTEFKDYWYSGVAELNSYAIDQVRYGENRKGTSVLVFVTEPFSGSKIVKVNKSSADDISVLKMNFTKEFITGIYPYSMMASVFHPVWQGSHVLKAVASIQEWCGQTYTEILNHGKWDTRVSSYFEDESIQKEIDLTWLEDELWTQIRIDPQNLPVGDIKVVPGMFYQRMMHVETEAYLCEAKLTRKEGSVIYSLKYPKLERTLEITFLDKFPHSIQGWSESYPDSGEIRTSTGQLIRQIRSAYWNQNHKMDESWRDSLFKAHLP